MTETFTVRSSGSGDDFQLVAVDLYRDIHKGIRAELFDLTITAGNTDPADRPGRLDLAGHIDSVARLLDSHAEHEDWAIDPVLVEFAPTLSELIQEDHHELEARFATIDELARAAVAADAGDERRLMHILHLELSGFTSAYLAHQLVEERVVMPTLEQAIGVEAVLGIHAAIIAAIPPDEMARSLAFMLPAMNLDDRTELLTGVRMAAPPEAFDAIAGLARSVLHPSDFSALSHRLGLV
jgi:hypothetical protein